MLPGARFQTTWSSTASALLESHGGQIRGAHPCEEARMGQPQVVVIRGADAQAWGQPPSEDYADRPELLEILSVVEVSR
jgi:hypothetical protein